MEKLSLDFYQQEDVLAISQALLGKFLLTHFDGCLTGGMIVETEAYHFPDDLANHAHGMRRTARNQTMFWPGGCCYVYLCYGIYPLFNVITNKEDIPHAVLIRAIEPSIGVDKMLKRRKREQLKRDLTGGPGMLTQALGINKSHNGVLLTGKEIWIEDRGITIAPNQIIASPRVGIPYAKEHISLPWRFRILDNHWTSPAR
jgi:DNA-3-methyladenine glycosylase